MHFDSMDNSASNGNEKWPTKEKVKLIIIYSSHCITMHFMHVRVVSLFFFVVVDFIQAIKQSYFRINYYDKQSYAHCGALSGLGIDK